MDCFLRIFTIFVLFIATNADGLGVVKISPESKEHFVKIGDPLSVSCYVTAEKTENDKAKWNIPSEDDVSINNNRVTLDSKLVKIFANLTIKSIKLGQLGTYKCSYQSSSASFKLIAATEEKSTANYTRGDKSVTLSCKIVGAAASREVEKVEWLKNDTLVSELTDHKRFTEDAENRTLVISGPRRKDADLYIARYHFKNIDSPYDCAVPYAAGPMVLDFDKSKNLIEDDKMELQCKVKGYPRAMVQWLKNGKPLHNLTDSKHIMLSPLDGYKNARLIIRSVQFEDAGDYTCKAVSDYFNLSDSKTLVVRVKDKLAALWPFLGIVGEVVILCTIIFIYEKRRNKQAESEANNADDVDGSTTDKKEGLRHRNTQSNNPTA